ncbi:MAG: vWA domain-containing protein, partial [Candidatus Kariarchaeaceae archaeon]
MSSDSTDKAEKDGIPKGVKEFFSINSVFQRDDSPEGEFQATRLSQAKTSLYLDLPFFGWILGQLEIVPTRDERVGTYAADTRRIYINPDYTSNMEKPRLKGMLMHLVTHLIMKHGSRKKTADGNIWGIASDVITSLMVEETKAQLFDDYRYDGQKNPETSQKWETDDISNIPHHLHDTSVEQNYSTLNEYAESLRGIEEEDEDQTPVRQEGRYKEYYSPEVYEEVRDYSGIDTPCGFGLAMDLMAGEIGEDLERLEDDRFKGILRNAVSQSRDFGKLPSGMQEMINHILNPKIPWYVLLEQYIQKTIVSDWRWNPPNRRMVGMDIHLPSTIKEYLNVVVAVDTSGSISSEELSAFATETHSILSSFSSVRMTLIDCDAEVQQVVVIEDGQTMDGSKLPWEGRPFKGR